MGITLFIEQREKAKSRIALCAVIAKYQKVLFLMQLKKEKQSKKMADFLTGLNIA